MKFVALALVSVALLAPRAAHAEARCNSVGAPGGPFVENCVAELPAQRVQSIAALQANSQWCWAASISMVFAYYGHAVSQDAVVSSAYGIPVNMPGPGATMTGALNANWVDGVGGHFRSTARVYDSATYTAQISNTDLIVELSQNRPVVVGSQGHAMLLTGLAYQKVNGMLLRVTGAVVQDPYPGRGQRQLSQQELSPTYAAVVSIATEPPRRLPPPTPSPSPSPSPTPTPSPDDATLEEAMDRALDDLADASGIPTFGQRGTLRLSDGTCDKASVTTEADGTKRAELICYPERSERDSQLDRDTRFDDLVEHLTDQVHDAAGWTPNNGKDPEGEPLGWDPWVHISGSRRAWKAQNVSKRLNVVVTAGSKNPGAELWPLSVKVSRSEVK